MLTGVKSHSEAHIIKVSVMKQSKRLNGDLKLEHKKIKNRITWNPTISFLLEETRFFLLDLRLYQWLHIEVVLVHYKTCLGD